MIEYKVKRCANCANSTKGIDEEPCNNCSHIYSDRWTPIEPELIAAAKKIKNHCGRCDCIECPFYQGGKAPECLLAPKDKETAPAAWEV